MNLPEAKFQYPLSDQIALAHTYSGLGPIEWVKEFNRDKAREQGSLFGDSLEDEIIAEFPAVWKCYKSPKAQIKQLAKRLKIDDVKFVEKAMEKAKAVLRERVLHENYIKHREYFDWKETPEYIQYQNQFRAAIAPRYAAGCAAVEDEIQNGEDHIIQIGDMTGLKRDAFISRMTCFQNAEVYMSFFSQSISRKDFSELLRRGLVSVIEGAKTSLLDYSFKVEDDGDKEETRHYCRLCGELLSPEAVGVNIKLGAQTPEDYQCYKHLGITQEQVQSMIAYYKSTGCPLFD